MSSYISETKAAANSLVDLITVLYDFKHDNVRSLTSLSKRTLVTSAVYIESSLISADIAIPLMGALNQLYLSYILTALNIYNSFDRYDVIRQTVGRVANGMGAFEDLKVNEVINPVDVINNSFGKSAIGTEDYDSTKIFTIEDAVKHLVVGRLIEFQFNIKDAETSAKLNADGTSSKETKSGTVTVPIYVQLNPVSMAPEVANTIITLNFPVSTKTRWKQVKAGEIRFFRDFILCKDLIEKHKLAVKQDTSNVLATFYSSKNKNQMLHAKSIIMGDKHNNVASSMVVITKATLEKACNDAHINFTNPNDRQRFFNESYAMIVAVVDEMYDLVDIYYNGISTYSEVPFKAISQAGSSKSGADLTEIMKTIAKGGAPRF